MGIFTRQRMLAAVVCTASMIGIAEHAWAQGSDDNQILTGSVDLDLGRFVVGNDGVRIGELTVSSNEVAPADGVQHSINVAAGGFARLNNGLLIQNNSGQDFQFDGTNPAAQSVNLDIFFFGSTDQGLDIQQQGLSGTNQTQVGDEVTTTFGGYWFQEGVYNDDADNVFVRELFGSNGRPSSASNPSFNRVDSPEPAPLPEIIRGLFSPPLRLNEEESTQAERRDALFAVQPSAPEDAGSLDLSGINITASGTPIANRRIGSGVVSLGRVLVGGEDRVIDLEETRVLTTSGSNDQRTQLELGGFNLNNGSGVTAVLNTDAPLEFNSAEDTAEVTVTGNFTIVGDEIGTFQQTVNAGSSISSVENLLGQNTQSSLEIGYQYSVVAENGAESEGVTFYKIDDFDTTGEVGRNNTLRHSESTSTHTAIQIGDVDSNPFSNIFSDTFTLNGSDLQRVTLNAANGGIRGEGLEGEQVTAETSYEIHTRSVQSSDLVFTPEGNVGESDIVIQNARVANSNQLQATAFLNGQFRSGSDRWYFDVDGGLDLEAGETVTLTPMFDEVGLVEEGLGRNFRTTFGIVFQDGANITEEDAVAGTVNGQTDLFSRFSRFDIFGSEESEQILRWVVERDVTVEATEGTISLAAGTSLRDEGLNLTNTSDNTTDGFAPSNVAILDGVFATAGEPSADVSLSFENLANATENQAGAFGFELLSSDIVDVTGLDGILHTIQLDYNFDSEDAQLADASLLWFDDEDSEDFEDGAWVNAVLGNSNVTEYDLEADTILLEGSNEAINLTDYLDGLQFELSYTDYLFSTEEGVPVLGAHGFDVETGFVWAVIDHNSFFASSAIAVPEPSTVAILSACGLIGLTRRRRSK